MLLVFAIILYDNVVFYETWSNMSFYSSHAWHKQADWLRVITYAGPIVVWLSFFLACFQVYQHQLCIQEDSAVLKHDRALQIILLPVVYGCMCLSCMTRAFVFLVTDGNPDAMPLALARAETCLWIGDLYEAWALFQFGVLSLEVMRTALEKQSLSNDPQERAAAGALLVAHPAIMKLAWIGIISFVLTSVASTGIALFWLTFGGDQPDMVGKFNRAESSINVAGFLACCAAIFNVYIVETQFHQFLEPFSPYLKFLTVKILVTFAYGQQYFFIFLQVLKDICPTGFQHFIDAIPVLGTIANFNELQLYMFYSSLLAIECFIVGLMHLWAWKAGEEWYDEELDEEGCVIDTEGSEGKHLQSEKMSGYGAAQQMLASTV